MQWILAQETVVVPMALKHYDVFVAGYDLAKLAGTDFFHTSVVICPAAAHVSRQAVQDTETLHDTLEQQGCEEMIFDRSEQGIWFNKNRGRWSLEDNQQAAVHWRHAGEVRISGATAFEVSRALQSWAAKPEAGNFSKGTYNFFSHNCNSFTAAILRKLGFDPQRVLACGSFSSDAKEMPCLAPESPILNPEMHKRFLSFL